MLCLPGALGKLAFPFRAWNFHSRKLSTVKLSISMSDSGGGVLALSERKIINVTKQKVKGFSRQLLTSRHYFCRILSDGNKGILVWRWNLYVWVAINYFCTLRKFRLKFTSGVPVMKCLPVFEWNRNFIDNAKFRCRRTI